jgi:hypothetical protein
VTENMYDFAKLLGNVPASLSELARLADVSERSIMRMRDGHRVQRNIANKVLYALSQKYNKTFTLDNVRGINLYERN